MSISCLFVVYLCTSIFLVPLDTIIAARFIDKSIGILPVVMLLSIFTCTIIQIGTVGVTEQVLSTFGTKEYILCRQIKIIVDSFLMISSVVCDVIGVDALGSSNGALIVDILSALMIVNSIILYFFYPKAYPLDKFKSKLLEENRSQATKESV